MHKKSQAQIQCQKLSVSQKKSNELHLDNIYPAENFFRKHLYLNIYQCMMVHILHELLKQVIGIYLF